MSLLPYQQRVVEEYEELVKKTLALGEFRQSLAHAVLDKVEQHLLDDQWKYMNQYGYVLSGRIARWSKT